MASKDTEALERTFPRSLLSSALGEYNLPSLDGLRALALAMVVTYPLRGPDKWFRCHHFLCTERVFNHLVTTERGKNGATFRSVRLYQALSSDFAGFLRFLVSRGHRFGVLRKKPVDWGHAASSFLYLGNYYQAFTGQWGTQLFHTWSVAT